jgi:hypothetical protein
MGSSSNRFGVHTETDRKMSLFPYFKVLPGEHRLANLLQNSFV